MNWLLALDGAAKAATNHFNWTDGVAMGLGNMGIVIFIADIVFLAITGYVLFGSLFQKTSK